MILTEVKNKIHGVVSLVLIGVALIIGFLSILVENINFATFYVLLLFASPFSVCYFYCRKCPCRIKNCGHVFPGKVTRIFKSGKSGKYNFLDYFVTISVLLLLVVFPQYWMIKRSEIFVLFWLLMIFAIIEARVFVCSRCENIICSSRISK